MKLIFRDQRFFPLFWTQFLGALTDNFFKNALIILIAYNNISLGSFSSGKLVALSGGIFILPFFLFSATAGQIADKYSKIKLIRLTKMIEVLIMACACLSFYFTWYGFLFVLLFLMGTQSSFFGPLKYGIIPELLKKNELISGNAYIGMGTFIAILIGTILGGASLTFTYPVAIITIGLLGLSLLGLYASFKLEDKKCDIEFSNNNQVDYTFIKPTWEILKLTFKSKSIFIALIGISWFWFLGAGILSLLPHYCKDILGGSKEVATLFLATFTIGMGAGSLLTNRISKGKVELGIIPIACLMMGPFLLDLYFVGNSWQLSSATPLTLSEFFAHENSIRGVCDLLFVSIFGGLFIIPQMTYIQFKAKKSELARTIAGNNIWNAFFMVMASVVIMFLHNIDIKVHTMFIILAALNTVISFLLYFARYSEESLRFLGEILVRIFYKTTIKGEGHIPQNGPYLIVSNHVSYIDWIFLMRASKCPIRFIIDNNYYNVPMGKFWFKQAKLVPIATAKEDKQVLFQAFATIATGIKQSHVYGLYPEGFLTYDGEMIKLSPGILRILRADPIDVLPITVDGLWGSMFSRAKNKKLSGIFSFPLRREIIITVGKKIRPDEILLKDLKEALDSPRVLDRRVIAETLGIDDTVDVIDEACLEDDILDLDSNN